VGQVQSEFSGFMTTAQNLNVFSKTVEPFNASTRVTSDSLNFSNNLEIGHDSKSFLHGRLDDIFIYNSALTNSQIEQLYNFKADGLDDLHNGLTGLFHLTTPNEFSSLPNGTINHAVQSQPGWSILDTGKAEYLSIPTEASGEQYLYIRLNSTTTPRLSGDLFSMGVDGLLRVESQQTPEESFSALQPTDHIPTSNRPSDTLDFNGANGLYYWELFFHAPWLIANTLNTGQKSEDAQRWYHYIFNPTISNDTTLGNDRYWRFLGLRSDHNPTLKTELRETLSAEIQQDFKNDSQLQEYYHDPFEPHAIARLRPIAYQKAIVMHYIDNLLDWGDDLFRQDTRETLVEAELLYVLAYDLLGKKPADGGECPLPAPVILKNLIGTSTNIPEFLLKLETQLSSTASGLAGDNPNNYIPNEYFGIPENDKFLGYWDLVKDRLYKLRHGLDIKGIEQQLPLFQPPIDPNQLIRAVASGMSISQALLAAQAAIPHYRFAVVIDKAKSVAATVIQFGSLLLSALEKKDAEQLAILRTTHEQTLLNLTQQLKQDQLKAAQESVKALQSGLAGAKTRQQHYQQLIQAGLSPGEIAHLALESTATALEIVAQVVKGVSIPVYLVPTVFGLADGDFKPGEAVNQGANILEGSASITRESGSIALTVAGYQRRAHDWELQEALAAKDIEQIQHQIQVSQYQQQVAQQEITLLTKNIEQENLVDDFLTKKFSNQDLYQWMISRLSTLYFQAYQLANQLALQAQRAYQFEQGTDQTFINPGNWDSLHKGLFAGEALMLDLQHLEKAYMDQDERRLEITKPISLLQLDPKALTNLKNNGSCTFDLSEAMFDYDYPGHYCRQIKSISVSLPAIVGPYQTIQATLTQTSHKTLLKPDASGVKYLLDSNQTSPYTSVLRQDGRANQQIALSQGINDSGLFEINFNDARYLPFEGTGAVSSWQLDMPKENNTIDFDSLSDVILKLHYTAASGDSSFRNAVNSALPGFSGARLFNLAQEFPDAWYRFISNQAKNKNLSIAVNPNMFPRCHNSQVTGLYLQLVLTESVTTVSTWPEVQLHIPDNSQTPTTFSWQNLHGIVSAEGQLPETKPTIAKQTWQLSVSKDDSNTFSAANLHSILLLVSYENTSDQ